MALLSGISPHILLGCSLLQAEAPEKNPSFGSNFVFFSVWLHGLELRFFNARLAARLWRFFVVRRHLSFRLRASPSRRSAKAPAGSILFAGGERHAGGAWRLARTAFSLHVAFDVVSKDSA